MFEPAVDGVKPRHFLEWSPVCCRRSPQWFLTPAPHHLKGIRAFDEPEDIRIIGDTAIIVS